MEDIGNALGTFVKIADQKKRMRYISYARICVYLDISKELPESIKLSWNDEEWVQPIDYEHIPFRCKRCHEYGYLFRHFPLNVPPQGQQPKNGDKDEEGFKKVNNRRRTTKRTANPKETQEPKIANHFATLSDEKEGDEGEPEKGEETTTTNDKGIILENLSNPMCMAQPGI